MKDNQTARTAVLVALGAVVGVLVVRFLLLDEVEEVAFQLFFRGVGEGRTWPVGDVLRSTTFWKCVAGAFVGGGIAEVGQRRMSEPRAPTSNV